jgi:hypothetical protein
VKVILTCAFPQPGYELPHQVLQAAGLATAARSRAHGMTPEALHKQIIKSDPLEVMTSPMALSIQQLAPDRPWQDLATDLFLSNADSEAWGWADCRLIYLLDFWKNFDPQIGFVLAYESPAAAVGGVLRGRQATEDELTRTLAMWRDFNTELLRFSYANRERCLLVNSAAVRQSPRALAERVAGAFDINLSSERAPLAALEPPSADAQLLEYLARDLVNDRDEPRALYEELESTADLPLVRPIALQAPAWNDYTEVLAAHAATLESQARMLRTLEQEKSALAARQAELEQLMQARTRERDDQSQKAEERRMRLAASTAELARLKGDQEALAEESKVTLLRLHQAQEELEECYLDSQKREDELRILQRDHAAVTKKNAEVDERLQRLIQAQHQQDELVREGQTRADLLKKANTALEQEVRSLTDARDLLQTANTALEQKVRSLTDVWDLLQTANTALEQKVRSLTDARDEQAKLAAERAAQLAAARATATADRSTELAKLNEQNDSLTRENGILVLQLHQLQEEVERYYIENRQLQSRVDLGPPPQLPGSGLLPAEVLYDLRGEIDGENWYYAEHDGRWAGPETCSTLRVPAMAPGSYRLELCVVDAMEPEIVSGMTLTLNGRPVAIRVDSGSRYAKLVKAQIAVGDNDREPVWEFAFRFPKLVSPAEHGSDDERHLAIRLASLCVRVQDPSAPWLQNAKTGPWWAFWKRAK